MAPEEHPLELLYRARDALQAAIDGIRTESPEEVSEQLGCYAAVDIALLYQFRTVAELLREKTADSDRPTVRVAHGELRDVVGLFDLLIAYVERHQPTIRELQRQARPPIVE